MCTQVYTYKMTSVNTRTFRTDLAKYLESSEPIAISRHGRTIGYYIPANDDLNQQELEALKRGMAQLQQKLNEYGIDSDSIVADFKVVHQ
jgi:PHD/YefM family antitoxin component YafN of YafNO toxin-antitoxin module